MDHARHRSIWLDQAPETSYPRLENDRRYDVAVVGGGITGVTTALLLAREGRSVGLVDQHVIAGGTTGHSTAKVTSQHSITYLRLRLAGSRRGAHVRAGAGVGQGAHRRARLRRRDRLRLPAAPRVRLRELAGATRDRPA